VKKKNTKWRREKGKRARRKLRTSRMAGRAIIRRSIVSQFPVENRKAK
jgi:hypothetical protein